MQIPYHSLSHAILEVPSSGCHVIRVLCYSSALCSAANAALMRQIPRTKRHSILGRDAGSGPPFWYGEYMHWILKSKSQGGWQHPAASFLPWRKFLVLLFNKYHTSHSSQFPSLVCFISAPVETRTTPLNKTKEMWCLFMLFLILFSGIPFNAMYSTLCQNCSF